MDNLVNINQNYEKIILINQSLQNKEFEDCVFRNCDFTNTNMGNSSFQDCEFIDCNLSMLQVSNASLKTVSFKNCKLLGVLFHNCTDFLFQVNFHDCTLDYASFSNKKMPKTNFNNCSMKETGFAETNLTSSIFDICNLENAVFDNTNLTSVDFSTSYNFKIDPEFNTLKKAKFSSNGLLGLLDKYDIKVI